MFFFVTFRNGVQLKVQADTYTIDTVSNLVTFKIATAPLFATLLSMADILYFSGPHTAGDGREAIATATSPNYKVA